MPARIATQDALHALFHPRAVAVIGASDDTTKHGRIVLDNVRAAGFAGNVYAINRRLTEIGGQRCYPDLAAVPEQVDAAFLAIPAEAVIPTLRDCARAGLKVAIVGSAGYAESLDAGGAQRQDELARIAAEEGVRIVGPNCNGIYNATASLSIGFNTAHAKRLQPGGIAILSHSGALFDAMAGRLQMLGAGLSLFASAGNEADFSVLDYMEYAVTHEPTRVIALLIDSLSDGMRFRRLATEAFARGKHVVALKIGTSQAGADAAVAHSSRLAGDAAAYAALFEAAGVARPVTLEGLMTASALLERYGRQTGALGALSTSGAGASLIADRCAVQGVALATFAPATQERLDQLRMFSRIGNPLDLGIFGGMRRAGEVPSVMAADPGVGVMLGLMHSMNPWQGDPIRGALAAAREASGKPLLIVSPGGMPASEREVYESHGMPVFTETDSLLEGVAALLTPPPVPLRDAEPLTGPAILLQTQRSWAEPESLELLARYDIPVVPSIECASEAAALAAAERLGWPVVLKGVVQGVAHKSDLGLVRTNLRDAVALTSAYRAVATDRVIVQQMIPAAIEAIAGVHRSADVGMILIAGLGGIYAEALRGVCMWSLPTTAAAIEYKLAGSTLGRVLCSERWRGNDTWRRLVDLLLNLQRCALANAETLAAIDINPVMLGANGVLAVDALVVPRAVA